MSSHKLREKPTNKWADLLAWGRKVDGFGLIRSDGSQGVVFGHSALHPFGTRFNAIVSKVAVLQIFELQGSHQGLLLRQIKKGPVVSIEVGSDLDQGLIRAIPGPHPFGAR